MPEYKRQHYLPTAYLKYFSADQTHCNRSSSVWRFDGKASRLVPVISQCVRDYHYSKSKAPEAERMFQVPESNYCEVIDKIKGGKPPSNTEYGNLLLAMFDFHLRNAAHKNKTGNEGLDAYGRCVSVFAGQILLELGEREPKPDELKNHIQDFWRIEVFQNATQSPLITSDHPSVWISITRESPGLHMVLLPLTPRHIAVGFDRRVVKVRLGPLSPTDVITMNLIQVGVATQCVFAGTEYIAKDMEIIRRRFKDRSNASSEVYRESWKTKLQGLLEDSYFSFMQRIPPLM